jgi:hypothetical protein
MCQIPVSHIDFIPTWVKKYDCTVKRSCWGYAGDDSWEGELCQQAGQIDIVAPNGPWASSSRMPPNTCRPVRRSPSWRTPRTAKWRSRSPTHARPGRAGSNRPVPALLPQTALPQQAARAWTARIFIAASGGALSVHSLGPRWGTAISIRLLIPLPPAPQAAPSSDA